MNERIQELLTHYTVGGLHPVELSVRYENQVVTKTMKCLYEDDVAKFAELIIRECAGLFVDQKYMILNPHEPFANERVRALKEHDKDTVRKIKQHFGVKE